MCAKKVARKKQNLIHITVSDEQKSWLDEMGGPTSGFIKIMAFWYSHFDLWEKEESKRVSIRKRLEGVK